MTGFVASVADDLLLLLWRGSATRCLQPGSRSWRHRCHITVRHTTLHLLLTLGILPTTSFPLTTTFIYSRCQKFSNTQFLRTLYTKTWSTKWMNGWMDGRIGGWAGGWWVGEWMSEWVNETNERTNIPRIAISVFHLVGERAGARTTIDEQRMLWQG